MAVLHQVRVSWTGTGGGPGVSTFYFPAASGVPITPLKALFTSIMTLVPNTVTVNFPVAGNDIDTASGQPTGNWTASSTSGVTGSGGINFAAPVGAVMIWKTNSYINGRQLKGKTFVVPLASGQYGSDGKLISACTNALGSAGTTFVGSSASPQVWSRRWNASSTATSCSVASDTAVLTSRRD